MTVELSEEGLRLATPEPLEEGKKVNLELYLREGDIFPIRLVGNCRWSSSYDQGPCLSGLDLSGTNARSLRVLRRFLQEFDVQEPN